MSTDDVGIDPPNSPEPQDEEEVNFALLCRLLIEGAVVAIRTVFDQIHPPMNLVQRLAQPQVHKTLRRLRVQCVINAKQWSYLFPHSKRDVSSSVYDPALLTILLKNICHLSPPYPNSWDDAPIPSDKGIAADLVRIQYLRRTISRLPGTVSGTNYHLHWKQITEVLNRLGGNAAKTAVQKIKRNTMDEKAVKYYIDQFREWDDTANAATMYEKRVDNIAHMRGMDHDLVQLTKASFALPEYARSNSKSEHQSEKQSSYLPDATLGQTLKIVSKEAPSVSQRLVQEATKKEFSKDNKEILMKFAKQIMETVKSEDVVSKLVKDGIFTHQEKNSINLSTKNPDRMKNILTLLPKKTGRAFLAFLDAIKYKHTTLYDQLIKAKQQSLLQEKTDELTQLGNAMRVRYEEVYSKYSPIPWRDVQVDFNEGYVPQYVTDIYGRILNGDNLFDPHPKCEKPHRLVLQGRSGTGKSTFCHHLTYNWSKENLDLKEKFKLVFFIDLRKAMGSLMDEICIQCLPTSYKKTKEELAQLIYNNQESVLFVLDNFDQFSTDISSIHDLLRGKLFDKSSILLTVGNLYANVGVLKTFDTRLVILGLVPDMQEVLIQKYIRITQTPKENYESLLKKVTSEDPNAMKSWALIPLYGLCMCLISEFQCNVDFQTVSFMLVHFMTALQRWYCSKMFLPVTNDNLPDEVSESTLQLEGFALESLKNGQTVFNVEKLNRKYEKQPFKSYGFLHFFTTLVKNKSIQYCTFTNTIFQEFLAARAVSRLTAEELAEEGIKDRLTHERKFHNVSKFFCGLLRFDYAADTIIEFFTDSAQLNKVFWKKLYQSEAGENDKSMKKQVTKTEGRVSDFCLTLECIAECEGRQDLGALIVSSFPKRLVMRPKDIPSSTYINGLSQILHLNALTITELDVRLDHFGSFYEYTYIALAKGLEKSSIMTLKLRWTNQELLSQFLVQIFGQNTSIAALKIADETKQQDDKMSATVWSNLHLACQHMQHLKTLAFTHCKSPQMVTSVIRNCPNSLEELHLNSCALDLVCSTELSNKIEKSPHLRVLNLSGIRIRRPDFHNLSLGLKTTGSLSELILTDMSLDNDGYISLCETLKLNKSIKRLDLSRNVLSDETCKALGSALATNKSILQLVILDCSVTVDGTRLIKRLKRQNVVVLGSGERSFIKRFYTSTRLDHAPPLPILKTATFA